MPANQMWQGLHEILTNHEPKILLGTTNFVGRTMAFHTREGRLGLLQIISFTENPHSVKVLYKLASNGDVTLPLILR